MAPPKNQVAPFDLSTGEIDDSMDLSAGEVQGFPGEEQPVNPYAGPIDNSVVGGAFRRGVETVKGIYHTIADKPRGPEEEILKAMGLLGQPDVIARRILKGWYETEKQAAKQTKEQFKSAQAVQGDPLAKTLRYGQAATTGLSMLDPFATGSVVNVNQKEAEGRNKEAIGAGAFDLLTLLVGRKTGEPNAATSVNRLGFAAGGAEESLEAALPEFKKTIAVVGKPNTLGEFADVVDATASRIDARVDTALSQMPKGKTIVPIDIANALEDKADAMPPTAEGQAIADELRSAANDYNKAWSYDELNAERKLRGDFYNKSGKSQRIAARSSAQGMIDKIAGDAARNLLYDEMERKFPGGDFHRLRTVEKSVIDVRDQLESYTKTLKHAQAIEKGKPMFASRLPVYGTATPGGAIARVHVNLPHRSPMSAANAAVRGAFKGPGMARQAVRAIPLSQLVTQPPDPRHPSDVYSDPNHMEKHLPAPRVE